MNILTLLGSARKKGNTATAPGCVQKDDVPAILEQMTGADLTLFASPLYFWGVSAQLKAVIDRTYGLYTRYHEADHASLLEGRGQAFLMTGAGGRDNNAEGAFTAFKRMQNPHKTHYAGEWYIGNCTTPSDMPLSMKETALNFARQICE